MKKRILIVGNDANAYALAKKMSEKNEVFITPSSDALKEFTTYVDIRENKPEELIEFVLENGIDLTIVISEAAIKSDIASIFAKNNQQIFAPTAKAAEIIFNKPQTKKIFYKLKIPTPKFGIFEKESMALDYIKNKSFPYVIKTADKNSATVITSEKTAKIITNSIFIEKNNKVLIEDFVYGTPFSYYAITDGYKALPAGNSLNFRHSLDGDGGQLTDGMASCVPNYKLSIDDEYFLMDNVIYPLLNYTQIGGSPYTGILGIDGIKTKDGRLFILGCTNFFQNADSAGIIETINEDLYSLFESCAIGSFSDEFDSVLTTDKYAVSLVLKSTSKTLEKNSINGLENLDENTVVTMFPNLIKNKYLEYEINNNSAIVLTSFAPTPATASERVYSEAESINFAGKFYRNDICKYSLS